MKTHLMRILALVVIVSMLLAACAPAAEPTEPPPAPTEAPQAEPTEAPEEEPTTAPAGGPADVQPGETVNMVLLPKFLGILVFDQANDGATEAHEELGNTGELQFLGPTPENSVAGQIEIVTTAATQGQDAIMISNNAGDQIAPAAQAARAFGNEPCEAEVEDAPLALAQRDALVRRVRHGDVLARDRGGGLQLEVRVRLQLALLEADAAERARGFLRTECGHAPRLLGVRGEQPLQEPAGVPLPACVRLHDQGEDGDALGFDGGAGATRFKDGEWRNLTVEQGLPDNRVYRIRTAEDGSVWFVTAAGVARLQGDELESYEIAGGWR